MVLKNNDLGLLFLRLSVGGLMLFHGIAKITHGIDFIEGMIVGEGLPGFLAYGVYIGEVVVPLLILVGFRTRLASLIYVINCLTIILLAHSADIFKLNEFGGWALELVGLYMLGALALFFTGGGRFSVSNTNDWD